jgi:DNA repair exonuclease SbcCD ATPase subunit
MNDKTTDQPQAETPAVVQETPEARAALALNTSKTERDLIVLSTKHASLVEIKDKPGREQVHGAAMELMRARTSIKNVADEARDDAKKFNLAVLAEEKRLTAMVEPEEKRLKALRDAWDNEQARIKKEAEEKERARLLALGARIQEIRGFARLAQDCRSSDAVRRLVDRMAVLDMTGFEEFEAEAVNVFAETCQQVENTLNTRLATEAEAARLKAEREELERNKAEAQRLLAEIEAKQKEAADKLAAERAEFQHQQEAFAAQQAAAAQAELDKIAADVLAVEIMKATTTGGVAVVADGKVLGAADIYAIELATDLQLSEQDIQQINATDLAALPVIQPEMLDADLVDTAYPIVLGIDIGTDAPPAASLIKCVAFEYGVDQETACQWLCARADEFKTWAPAAAAIA